MKRNRLKIFHHRKKTVQRDNEGNTYPSYSPAVSFEGEAWPASGKIQAEIYGQRLPYIYNLRINGRYEMNRDEQDKQIHYSFSDTDLDFVEGDGICLFVEPEQEPDYRIISIRPHRFLRLEVERI